MTLVFRGSHATVIASTQEHFAADAASLRDAEIRRRQTVCASLPIREAFVEQLVTAADQYIVRRGEGKTVIAGYHWFGDWGRDTMIALPGLTLATGRPEIARDVLCAFASHVSDGMLPNRFPDAGEAPEYNTADATLWFFEAVRSLLAYTNDYDFVRTRLYDTLKHIVEWHLRGTRYGIHVDEDGLLNAGVPGVQLTWMDAKIGEWVVTPRHGKPVEIQALWYSALRVMEDLAARFGDTAARTFIRELATHASDSFDRQFWNHEAGCLYDVVDGQSRDASIRPNQIFAVSLHHALVAGDRARRVVEVVHRELFTPMGLRSLSPRDSRYRSTYEGGVYERDSAYHQGTVWPWLMGPFITAWVKVNGSSGIAVEQAAGWLRGLEGHMRDAGVGQVSEICDAEWPHGARGCVAQAWSIAELLRATVEDIFVLSRGNRAIARTV
jgi:predicted glycogen debranching enzyme